jgi:hypothetical protein
MPVWLIDESNPGEPRRPNPRVTLAGDPVTERKRVKCAEPQLFQLLAPPPRHSSNHCTSWSRITVQVPGHP